MMTLVYSISAGSGARLARVAAPRRSDPARADFDFVRRSRARQIAGGVAARAATVLLTRTTLVIHRRHFGAV